MLYFSAWSVACLNIIIVYSCSSYDGLLMDVPIWYVKLSESKNTELMTMTHES